MLDLGNLSATSPVNSPGQMSPAPAANSTPVGGELGTDQFMTLLVAQLKNQDPLKPIENTEFISQLATFSTLEKLTSIEAILKSRLGITGAAVTEPSNPSTT
jgi:flagellar basal-body rod modification protein FlgD